MYKIATVCVSGATAVAIDLKPIPRGITGAVVELRYDDSIWAGLRKKVAFRGSGETEDLCDENTVTFPAEVAQKKNARVSVGITGVSEDGTVIIPTLWADLGSVRDSAYGNYPAPGEPVPPVWAQLLTMIGDLKNLDTEAKDNLVNAINEAMTKGDSGGSGVYTLAEGESVEDVPPEYDVVIDPYAEPEVDIPAPEADISLNVEGASVGQIVKIASVDDAGKPTAWEAVEMPSGGGEKEWAYYREQEVGTDDGISVIEFDNLLQYDEALLFISTPYGQTCAAAVYINGVQVEKDWYNFQHASNNRQNTLHINRIKENYYWVSGYGGNSCSTKATHRVSSELKLRGICDATSSGGINKIGFTVSPILSSASNGSKCIIRYFAR